MWWILNKEMRFFSMNPVYEKLMTCLKSVQEKVSFQPEALLS